MWASTKGNKADRIDAARIAELLRLNALTPVYHRGGETRALKELVRLYEGLVDNTTRVMLISPFRDAKRRFKASDHEVTRRQGETYQSLTSDMDSLRTYRAWPR